MRRREFMSGLAGHCGVAAARMGTTAYKAGDRISPSVPHSMQKEEHHE
jgi:hypothetical protein